MKDNDGMEAHQNPSTNGGPQIDGRLRDALCRAIDELEQVVAFLQAEDPVSLRQFLNQYVRRGHGQLSLDLILCCYAEWLTTQGQRGMPRHIAAKQLPRLVSTLYGVPLSHSLRENGKAVRGFWGLVLE